MEIRRFGVGHRRPDGPPGTRGVQGQVIHGDSRGQVAELALARYAFIEPHTNPNTTLFVVIEGGGFVRVGEEQARVAAGEAVIWPAGVLHGAWTELSEMRAIVVEFEGGEQAAEPGASATDGRELLGQGSEAASGAPAGGGSAASGAGNDGRSRDGVRPARGEGSLVPRRDAGPRYDPTSGEPY